MIETSETASNNSGAPRNTRKNIVKKDKIEKVDANVLHLKNISEIITVLI